MPWMSIYVRNICMLVTVPSNHTHPPMSKSVLGMESMISCYDMQREERDVYEMWAGMEGDLLQVDGSFAVGDGSRTTHRAYFIISYCMTNNPHPISRWWSETDYIDSFCCNKNRHIIFTVVGLTHKLGKSITSTCEVKQGRTASFIREVRWKWCGTYDCNPPYHSPQFTPKYPAWRRPLVCLISFMSRFQFDPRDPMK